MCGICGFWSDSLEPSISVKNIESMTQNLRHRGPNGQGKIYLENDRLSFGHTRLSILDLSVYGTQPMSYQNRFTISYNGEIFNFIELREELKNLGHSFNSNTDTEVILAAYAQWGSDCLLKFNGMWAFAIWDSYEKTLFLSRDRYGIKPLYYTSGEKGLFGFASETNALKILKGFTPRRSENLINRFLQNPSEPESQGITIYENIRQIKPGHSLKVKNYGQEIIEKRWWDQKDHLVDVPDDYNEQVAQFKELLFDSCKLRLRSDVPIASAVSGGLDSSSIFAILNNRDFQQKLTGQNRISENFQKGFFVSFPGSYSDEKEYADEVFNQCGSNFSAIIHQPSKLPDLIVKTTEHFDTIYWTPLATLTPLYQKMAEDEYKISLDGHGVDEMLMGYTDMLNQLSIASRSSGNHRYADNIAEVERNLVFDPNNSSPNPYHPKESFTYKHKIPLSAKLKIAAGRARQSFWPRSEPLSKQPVKPNLGPNKPPRGYESFDPISQEFFFKTTLPTILRNFDRASMYHGVEVRMPFMDYRLVSYVMSLPTTSKVKDGYTKAILRDSMEGILPDKIRKRKWKVGITAPLASWFSDKNCSELVRDIVNSSSFQNSSLWDGKAWKKRIGSLHTEQDWLPHADEFWRLLNTEIILKN
jgi:asparagine synthase (glutamine-hydrolysing)